MVKVYLAAATMSAAILAAGLPALARGPWDGAGGPGAPAPFGAGHRPGGPGGVFFERLIFPCRSTCRDGGRTCLDSADATAVSCAESTCADAVTAARSACADDLGAAECRDARNTLRDCAQSCLTTRRTAADACHTTVDDCLDACDDTTAE